MKFKIGDIVKYIGDKEYTYIVIATKESSLNQDFLAKMIGKLQILNIEVIAKNKLMVKKGFHYKIANIKSYDNEIAILGERFTDVFESEIEH